MFYFLKVGCTVYIYCQPTQWHRNLCTTRSLWQLLDSWVNMALLPVFHSGLTGLEISWASLTIAAWLRLLPSLAWLKLYLRVFGQANPSLRSYLIDWSRCSLLDQPCLQFLWLPSGWLHSMFSKQLLDPAEALLWVYSHGSFTIGPVSSFQFPSNSSARVCWAAATLIFLHQLSKDLLSRCYRDSARICWVWLSLQCVHNRRLSLLHKLSKDLLSLPE